MTARSHELDEAIVGKIRDLLDSCRSRNDVDAKAWNAARMSATGLFRTEAARTVSSDQLDRIIAFVKGSRSFTVDTNIASRFGDLRRGVFDELLSLQGR